MLKMTINRPPHPALAPYVDYVLSGQDDGTLDSIDSYLYKDLPNANARIVFKIGPQPGQCCLFAQGPRLRLTAVPANAIEIFSFTLKPGALKPLVGVPVSVLSDRVVNLSSVWGKEADNLRERMFLAPTMEARILLLEAALIQRAAAFQNMDYFVQDVARLIEKQGGRGSLEPVFLKTGYTQRQVLRKFDDWMGMARSISPGSSAAGPSWTNSRFMRNKIGRGWPVTTVISTGPIWRPISASFSANRPRVSSGISRDGPPSCPAREKRNIIVYSPRSGNHCPRWAKGQPDPVRSDRDLFHLPPWGERG